DDQYAHPVIVGVAGISRTYGKSDTSRQRPGSLTGAMTFRRFDTPLPSPAGLCLLAVLITLAVAVTGCRASSPSLDDSAVAPSEAEAETPAWTGTPTEADGVLPTGTTTADGHLPGIANLEPGLREALSRATEAARQ